MSKDLSAPLARTARLLDLVPYLNTHQGISLKELARHFDVSVTQMSADLTTLWMCGLPGYSPLELMDLEFESGYVTISNAETLSKPRSISFQEGVALLLGLDLIAASFPPERDDLDLIARSLRERISDKLGVPVHVQASSAISTAVTATVKKALDSNSGLQLRYHALYKDSVTDRSVMPIEVYESDGNQYLRAYCFNAKDLREFRIDRIMEALPESIPSAFEHQDSVSEKIQYSITVNNASRDAAERFALQNLATNKKFSLSSYSKQWIERSVLASGGGVVLNSPVDIREHLLKSAQEMLNRYKES